MQCIECGVALDGAAASSAPGAADWGETIAAQEAVRRLRRYIPAVVAEAILRHQERLRGERREVAVLFADAVEFTRLAASLDAESVFNLINDLLSRLVACVHRYDGVVDKFTGDGLMAVFGAPVAHENDPELAVRAALDMQRAAAEFEPIARAQLGAPLKIRVGIHSGLVVAGIIGTQDRAAYTVIGDTVNLAARLESLARPGHILVSSRVHQQTRPFFNFQPMGTTQVKGFDQPVVVYEAVGDRSQPLPARGVASVSGIFLGRDSELDQLRSLFAAFLDDRCSRLVTVQGEAGMGKSRLVSEWLTTIDGDGVTIWQGRALPYAHGVGYGIFRSLFRDALDVRDSREEWEARVSPSLRLFLRQMLGLPLTPDERASLRHLEPERVKQLTVLALRQWILGEARQQPILLILDDFHWADDFSRDMLRKLVDLDRDAPVLICVMTRPQPESPLELSPPSPPTEEARAAPVHLGLKLQPLSPEHSRALLAHLVDLSSLPEVLVDTILTHAEGNPFYIEEFVRMLIEKEVLTLGDGRWQVASAVALRTLEIPTTLRGLMMARVDRLPEDLEDVLRSASVIGLQFSSRLLEEVERRLRGAIAVTPALERLKDLELLVERPQTGEQMYAFRHIITQETVYRSLLRSQRPGLHRVVAECIEDLHAPNLSDQVEVLALHYDRARMHDKAMRYALLAGNRAQERFANREAIEYYSRALQLSQHLSDYQAERWDAAVGLGKVEQRIGEYEEATACYRAALDEWKGAAPEARAQAMLGLAQIWNKRGDLEEAESWLHQCLTQLGHAERSFPTLRAQVYSELGWLSLRRGDLDVAQEWLEKGLELAEGSEDYSVISSILNRLGAVHYNLGELSRAVESIEQALELHEQMGDMVGVARSSNNLGILKKNSGNWNEALSYYRRSLKLMERIGEVEGLALAYTNLGVLYTDRGQWKQAEENLRRSFAIAQRIGHPYELAQAHMNLGRLYLLQERWDDCARHLRTSISLYREAGAHAHPNLNVAYCLLGRLQVELGQIDAAQEWADRSYELLQEATGIERGESIEWGRYEQLTGCIAQARGDLPAAHRHLERSASIFRATGSQIEAGRTATRTGLISLQLDRPERAREELIEARRIFTRLEAAADLQRVEQQLAQLESL